MTELTSPPKPISQLLWCRRSPERAIPVKKRRDYTQPPHTRRAFQVEFAALPCQKFRRQPAAIP
jgi:hypothetical protein